MTGWPGGAVAALLAVVALAAATLAGVTGFGGAAVLLPVLVGAFGIRDAIPILTVAQLVGNGSRVWFNRSELDLRVALWYTLGAVPFGLLGGFLFAEAPLRGLERLLGIFLILIVVWRHRPRRRPARSFPVPTFAAIGAGASVLSALVGSVGPIMAPLFLAYGLVKGAYIGTEALATVVTHVAKLAAYGEASVMSWREVGIGLALGPLMVTGSYLGKRITDRLAVRTFTVLIELTMLVAGVVFAIRG
ncbi:MAG: sulfite exporter TauE/SafE family protein [Gemmatimonadota bacterium]|nr:sulfite exporter TauE/SafE family protein [Gemmatimonadota bacterium]